MGSLNRTHVPQSAPKLVRRAEITKQELAVVSAQYGAGNMARFEGYEPNTLRLETFIGSWDSGQRKFVGEYHFVSGGSWLDGEVEKMCDFNKLSGIALQRKGKAKPTPPTPPQAGGNEQAESEVSDVADV